MANGSKGRILDLCGAQEVYAERVWGDGIKAYLSLQPRVRLMITRPHTIARWRFFAPFLLCCRGRWDAVCTRTGKKESTLTGWSRTGICTCFWCGMKKSVWCRREGLFIERISQ
ncbi:MAG: hypothetical protein K2O15_11825 [Lachnospiraceae bacterium]|nr:hypothetical protein [Lachnospiraceae bacterium]